MLPLKRNLVLLAVLLSVCSCIAKLTPTQQAVWAANIYNYQYNLYLEQVIRDDVIDEDKARLKESPSLITDEFIDPDVSEDQWKILKVKRDILIQAKPLVVIVGEYSLKGEVPSDKVISELTRLINLLITGG